MFFFRDPPAMIMSVIAVERKSTLSKTDFKTQIVSTLRRFIKKNFMLEELNEKGITFVAKLKRQDVKKCNKWYIDSGASAHICNNKELFLSLDRVKSTKLVTIKDGTKPEVHGKGIILPTACNGGTKRIVELQEVLFISTLSCNLMSVQVSEYIIEGFVHA